MQKLFAVGKLSDKQLLDRGKRFTDGRGEFGVAEIDSGNHGGFLAHSRCAHYLLPAMRPTPTGSNLACIPGVPDTLA
ncbi:hypothetical protein GCM10011591_22320 [Nocardia camponoti]|uniref:Uncharacterized protein n=1 Tax=Nocardia camponoti TaxID=1616106 RepID=A0A917V8Z5_9NOCA|nr:hypothetical protein GCM10011591_22320 [Nocardia camponoti]